MEPTGGRPRRGPVSRFASITRPLWRGVLLALIALGGAGLAVAVDRPQNTTQRPELSWRSDQRAAPWIQQLSAALMPLEEQISALSEHAQGVLGSITSLELDKADAALSAGDEASAQVASDIEQLTQLRDDALASLDEWRLGETSGATLDAQSAATDAVQQVPAYWQSISDQAQRVVGLVRDLREHDDLVFQATAAGRESRWSQALRLLGDASARLEAATSARDEIAGQGEVKTLDDLLARDREYDAALTDLYTYVRDTGNLQGADFDAREQRVRRAQDALPRENSVFTVIAAEAAAEAITNGLVAIEEARGAIIAAQEAALGSPEPTTQTEPTAPSGEPGEPIEPSGPLPTTPGGTSEPTLPPA